MNAMMRGNNSGSLQPIKLSTKLNQIAEKARSDKEFRFKTLAHMLNEELLIKAFRELSSDASAGVDGVTLVDYRRNLTNNIVDLVQRVRLNKYRAQPLRRVYIEKENGKKRPISIPVLEDKIVQKAVVIILNQIYEVDFYKFSYGYRLGQSAHQAIHDLRTEIAMQNISYILDADIMDFFGNIVRKQLMEMLQKRITDKAILRLIGKWLKVGVVDNGQLLCSDRGTYQGSAISPLLANIYLHEVLDHWIQTQVTPRLKGRISLFRYADDFILCFQHWDDAKKVYEVLQMRFAKYGLAIHPEKTKMTMLPVGKIH